MRKKHKKMKRRGLGPLSEGAVTEGDWGSVLSLYATPSEPPNGRPTSLKEGGKGYTEKEDPPCIGA